MSAVGDNREIDTTAIVNAAHEQLSAAGVEHIEAALILGTGLSYLADALSDPIHLPYADIQGFPQSTVEGHAGNFVVGSLEGVRVGIAQGRFHYYEGYPPAAAVLTVRVLASLGARYLLITNAAGSVDHRMPPGTLMAIRDHINLQFRSPLIGRAPDSIDNPFPDMSLVHDDGLRDKLHALALEEGILLREGVYAGVLGPSYETPAEIVFLRQAGVDAVGMSTVGEVATAAELRLPVVGISLITNYAAGLSDQPLTHAEVTEAAEATREPFGRLVRSFVKAA